MAKQRMTPAELEREMRRALASLGPGPTRRLLRKMLVIRHGRGRYREERIRQMSTAQLLNNWAACEPENPEALVDLSSMPDWQLVRAVSSRDIGVTAHSKEVLADSAIAELAKRANMMRLTVADYIRRRTKHDSDGER
jgi:hypothetical protein